MAWLYRRLSSHLFAAPSDRIGQCHSSRGTCGRLFCGAIAVFVGVGSSLSRWFRKRRGRFRVFCFPTKEANHGKRLMNGIFKRLLNVKGMVVESSGSSTARCVLSSCSRSMCAPGRRRRAAHAAGGNDVVMAGAAACAVGGTGISAAGGWGRSP